MSILCLPYVPFSTKMSLTDAEKTTLEGIDEDSPEDPSATKDFQV